VLVNPKLGRRQPAKIVQAAGNVKSTIALLALKMMVMSFVGALVSSRFSRYFDGLDPALSHQCRNRAVDGCHAEASDAPRRRLEQLIDAKGPFSAFQDGAHGVPLLCFPANANHDLLSFASAGFTIRVFSGRAHPAPAARP
jgi:hypothetical protein